MACGGSAPAPWGLAWMSRRLLYANITADGQGDDGMIAIGCLAPFILGVAGFLAGNWLDGSTSALWGGAGGFVLGGLFLGVMGWVARQLRQ